MDEIWKPLKGYEKQYIISSFGNIKRIGKDKNISTSLLYGYVTCCLCKNNIQKTKRVHRLVAQTFLDEYFDGCEVHHIDNNKKNNHISNLECITKIDHLKEHGKGTKKIYKEDKYGNKTYYDGVRIAARENNVSHQCIIEVLKGKRKSCVGCKWFYCDEVFD